MDYPSCNCCPPGVECPIHCCTYCGGLASAVDHVWPRADGGCDEIWNRKAACKSRNSSKGAQPLLRFLSRAVLAPHPDERQQAIIDRLMSGRLEARLGVLHFRWLGYECDEDRDESERGSLVRLVQGDAWNEGWGLIQDFHRMSRRARDVFGDEWSEWHENLIEGRS